MNRFFKVIWCEALNDYVVAAGFAKGRTKSASMRKLIAVLVAGGMLGTGFVNSVDAASSKGSQQITITDKDTTGATTEIKTIFYIESEWPTYPYAAGGYSSISSWSGHAANNYDKIVQAGTTWEGTNNISLGLFTNAGYALKENADGDYKILRGTNANPVYYHGQQINGPLGYDIDESKQYNYATAFGIRTAAANRLATAWGSYSVASGLASTAFGHRTIAKGEYSIAWGEDTKASGNLSTSWGSETLAGGISTTAWGTETQATSNNATAWGWNSKATGNQATAWGCNSEATGYQSTAWGYGSKATGDQSTAFGNWSYANAKNSLAVAGGEVASDATNGIAIGWYANSTIKDGIALGNGSVTTRTAGVTNAYGKGDSTGNAWVSTSVALAVGKDADVTRQITGVAAGSNDTDAVNVAQLKKVASQAERANQGWNLSINGAAAAATKVAPGGSVDFSGDDNVSVSNKETQVTVALNKDVKLHSATFGDTVINDKGLTIGGGTSDLEFSKNRVSVGGQQIHDVADGEGDMDAVNMSQLKKQAAASKTTVSKGTNTTVTSTVAEDGHTDYTVNLNKDLTGIESMTNGLSSIRMGNGGTVTINNRVNIDQSGKISGVAAGEISSTSTDAVNGSQLHAVQQEAGKHTKVVNGSNITVEETDQDGQKTYKVGLNKDLLLGDITGKNVSISGTNGTIETTGSIATKDKIYADKGAKLADIDITGDTISNGQSSVKLDKEGTVTINGKVFVNQNGKVSGVAAGDISATSKDAVNGSQLFATNQQVAQNAQSINKLGNRINKVGAGAAALAALHPLDFDPDDKWDFAAGYGNYNGENAAAIGAYYRPNEDTMFSVGGSFGNGENMVNAGVSLKLGQGNHVSTSKVAMAKEIKDLRKELEGLKSALLDANAGKKLDTSKLQLFPDVPKNHWAYEYVSTLKGNGALTGYPDGEFKGDRPMTRYEFATMLYKAMLEGATLSDKILKEFAPELERFTVDTVHQDKDGKPTVERVRTVKAEK